MPPQGQAVDQRLATQVSAEQHMLALNGELSGNVFDAGFDVKSKVEGRVSEDVAYLFEDNVGQTFIGVFDGMGGHKAGDMAANAARDTLHKYATTNKRMGNPNGLANDFFEDAVDEIGSRIDASNGEAEGAGTTGLMGVLVENEDGSKTLHGAAVGDSLGFVVRSDGRVEQLNKEESYRQELLDAGASIEAADAKGNVITNAVSPGSFNGVHQRFETVVNDGDVIVFTSDGITGDKSTQQLSGGYTNEEVISRVALDPTLTAKQKSQRLIELSTKKDDKTAVVLEIKSKVQPEIAPEQPATPESEAKKAKGGRIAGALEKIRASRDAATERRRADELVGYKPNVADLLATSIELTEAEDKARIVHPNERIASALVTFDDRALSEVWVVGDSVIGLVDTFNKDGTWKESEMLLMPFGGAAGDNRSSVQLNTPDKVEDGIIKINRNTLKDATGVEDSKVSRGHLQARVSSSGTLMLSGKSLNGTHILNGDCNMTPQLEAFADYIRLVNSGVLYPSQNPKKGLAIARP